MEIKVALQADGSIAVFWPQDKPALTLHCLRRAAEAVEAQAAQAELQPRVQPAQGTLLRQLKG